MRTEDDLRAAYGQLAEQAPHVEDLQLVTRAANAGGHRRVITASVLGMAAVVAAVVVVAVHGQHQASLPPAAGQPIVCAPIAGQTPSAGQLDADRTTILHRLTQLGVRKATVDLNADDELVITAPSATRAQLANVCADHPLELRPLVAPAVPLAGTGGASKDPLSALPFTVPTSESAHQRLSSAQQNQLSNALAHARCSSLGASTPAADRVVCDTETPPATALLLGPAVVDGTQVATASAVPPNVSTGQTGWTVTITFTPAGRSAWAAYTTAHNAAGAVDTASPPTACSPAQTPCADFVAFVANGTVLSTPITLTAITGGSTQISGDFTPDSAAKLAAQLAAGQLAVPLHTVSPR